MKGLPAYQEYKDSGLPWLGQVPEHWDVLRSKYVFREVDVRSATGEETQLSMSQVHGLVESSKIDTWRLRSESYAGGKLCESGDLVLNRLKAHLGVFAHAPIPGVVSPDYTVFRRVREVDVRYFEHLYKSPIYKAELRKRTKGIVEGFWRLYSDDFYDLRVVVPPHEEQIRIMAFVDSFNRRVNRLIRNKRRLIALLNEQKQTIINQAVTRGLDPNASMKPTGIDWMPEIPAHWDFKRLKYLTRFKNGFAFKPSDWKDSGIPIVRIENLNGSESFNYTDRKDIPEHLLLQPGDLVFAWSGNRGTSFGSFEWNREFAAYLNQHIFKLDGYKLNRRYFYYLLRAVTKHVEDNAHGIIGLVHITKPALGAIFVPLATEDEQVEIANRVDAELAELNEAIEKIRSEVELIREYRERLIADVVTGKLDVREVPVELPTDDVVEDLEEEGADDLIEDEAESEEVEE